MNIIDWIISLLPHPRKRTRTGASIKVEREIRSEPRFQTPAVPPVRNPDLAPPHRAVPGLASAAVQQEKSNPVSEFSETEHPESIPFRLRIQRPVMIGGVALAIILMSIFLLVFTNSVPASPQVVPTQSVPPTGVVASPIPTGVPSTLTPYQPATRPPDQPIPTPTADAPKPMPTLRANEEEYIVQRNDSLNIIANKFNVDVQDIITANKLTNPNQLAVGQRLVIPVVTPRSPGPGFKIIPDSELILSPYTTGFSVKNAIAKFNGFLLQYEEKVDDRMTAGVAIVERISREYSVNPRILLAVLEYQSGWVTRSNPSESRKDYPMGHNNAARKGLYRQLAWAANLLNQGYYLWQVNGIKSLKLTDGSTVPIAVSLNPGTVGVQNLMSALYNRSGWDKAVADNGVFASYSQLFGYPFDYTYSPILPADLTQPDLRLPFEDNTVWSFTGAPHGAWGDGSAWAALDFAPPGDGAGCIPSAAWVTAVTSGLVVRSENGVVVIDLDGDGAEQTGWTILYLHIASSGRIKLGTRVKEGDRIGHPSCEGGISNGTHVHIARRYNGEWISADGPIPFKMDGWVAEGAGVEYYGYMRRNDQVVEAWDRRVPANQITR